MTRSPWRIVRWQYKLLYVIVAEAAGFGITRLGYLLLPSQIAVLIVLCVDVAIYLVGARIFRGTSEDLLTPRAWWRMTSKPTLSRRLGTLFAVVAGIQLIGLALVAIPFPSRQHVVKPNYVGLAEAAIETAILAFLYLNSAVRLKNQSDAAPAETRPIDLDQTPLPS